jgi:diguanylate cyclase (GGDEF)-like protein
VTHAFPTGQSDIYIRAETADPLLLPIVLTHIDDIRVSAQWSQYAYGLMYGYLFALIAYNLMLYAGLRKRSYLYYLLYLSSFILANLAYTGHGFAWLWPESTLIQRYIILVCMVLYSCCGLIFAARFLTLSKHAPRLLRWVRGFTMIGPCLMGLAILLNAHLFAVIVAFSFMVLFTLLMVLFGSLALWQRQTVAGYFLSAALFGMLGTAITTFAVLGWLPFTPLTYHSINGGILIEATLLALALTHQVREQQSARASAEHMARHDPLTGLLNRRGFHDLAHNIWSNSIRKQRPISIIMIDIDYFKRVNDKFGHTMGDQVLINIAQLLASKGRAGDLLARWGGEEFIILLPEAELEHARFVAERIRISIERTNITFKQSSITTTASLGVAVRALNHTLYELINEADKNLYNAKKQGRNQINTANQKHESASYSNADSTEFL